MFISISFVVQFTLVGQFYLVYLADARSQKGYKTTFGNCSGLFGVPMKLQCIASITRELRSNYNDNNVVVGTPYAIFAPDVLMVVLFITMYPSPIMDCPSLTVIEWDTFQCNENQLIKLNISKLFCYHYPMRYFADLRDNCFLMQNHAFNFIDHSALHYAGEISLAKSWNVNCWLFKGLMVWRIATLRFWLI